MTSLRDEGSLPRPQSVLLPIAQGENVARETSASKQEFGSGRSSASAKAVRGTHTEDLILTFALSIAVEAKRSALDADNLCAGLKESECIVALRKG